MNSIAAVYTETRGSPLFPTIARASAAGLLHLPAKPRIRQRGAGGDARLPAAGRQAADQGLDASSRSTPPATMPARSIALDRLMPLVAVAGIDDPKRLPPSEVNRWYEAMRQDDPARAPLRGYLLLELFRATGIDMPPRRDRPARGAAGRRAPGHAAGGHLAGAAVRGAPGVAAPRRRCWRRSPLGETPLGELHPAAVAAIVRALRAGRRGPCRRACSRSRRRSRTACEAAVKKQPPRRCRARPRPSSRCCTAERGASQEHRGGLRRRSQEPRGLPGAAQAEAGRRPTPTRCAPT